jgi:hypothetical protein
MYDERDQGGREPFTRWINHLLQDFELSPSDFFGATTDGSADVKCMMESGLHLNWEWCWPHLTNAATKAAFGMTGDVERSKTPGMRKLLSKVTTSINQVRSVEVMGNLYAELISTLGFGKERKLVDYKPHRFMGLTPVFRRILKHWAVLDLWYEERMNKFERHGKVPPNPFSLAGRKLEMEQLLSLLEPVSSLNGKSQAEKLNQVDVLLSAYKMCKTILAVDQPLLKYDSTREHIVHYHPAELVALVETTRSLLSQAFYSRCFFTLHQSRKK